MRPDASENSQINPSTIVRAARASVQRASRLVSVWKHEEKLKLNNTTTFVLHSARLGAPGARRASEGFESVKTTRAYMTSVQTERGDEPDNSLRQIQFMKNNYGPAGDMITIRWKQGVYVLEGAATQLERWRRIRKRTNGSLSNWSAMHSRVAISATHLALTTALPRSSRRKGGPATNE